MICGNGKQQLPNEFALTYITDGVTTTKTEGQVVYFMCCHLTKTGKTLTKRLPV